MIRQRRLALAAIVVAVALVAVVALGSLRGGDEGSDLERAARDTAKPEPPRPPELPRGGRRIFPDHRVVGFYGAPQAAELGILGIGDPAEVGKKLEKQARPYATPRRKLLPAFELLATIANPTPGDDGTFRSRQEDAVIDRYLAAARAAKAILVLDIQPGQADFLTEAKALERYLREPDVSLALDPEWRMEPGEIPGQVIGSVAAAEVNQVSAYLADIVKRGDLPEKLLIVHQFTPDMVENKEQLARPPGVAITFNVDGFGEAAQKVAKYDEFTAQPPRFRNGFKLFYKEDTGLMTPEAVLALKPQPDLVMYE